MPTIETQTENYQFDDKRKFNPDLYVDSTLRTLFLQYNAALDTLATPLCPLPKNREERESTKLLLEQKEQADLKNEQIIKTHRHLLLVCQEKENKIEKTQQAKDKANAKLKDLAKTTFFDRLTYGMENSSLSQFFLGLGLISALGCIVTSVLGITAAVVFSPVTPFIVLAFSLIFLVSYVAALLIGLKKGHDSKKELKAEITTALQSHEKQEKLLQTEIQQFSMDMLEKVEMTGTAVQATQDVPEVVGMKNTRDAFFQVNPSATATVTMTPKFVSAPGQ